FLLRDVDDQVALEAGKLRLIENPADLARPLGRLTRGIARDRGNAVVRDKALTNHNFTEHLHDPAETRLTALRLARHLDDAGRNNDLSEVLEVRPEAICEIASWLRIVRANRRREHDAIVELHPLALAGRESREIAGLHDVARVARTTDAIDPR